MRRLLQERLSEAMRAGSLNAEKLAQAAGVPRRAIDRWLEDGIVPGQAQVQKLAAALGVTLPYLMDWDSMYPYKEDEEAAITYQIIGDIRIKEDGRIEEHFLDAYEAVPQSWLLDHGADEFCLVQAPGADMVPVIMPQDLLFCRKAPVVPDGSIAVVLNGDDPAGLRTVRYGSDGELIVLSQMSPESRETRVEGSALARCHIIAQVLRILRILG